MNALLCVLFIAGALIATFGNHFLAPWSNFDYPGGPADSEKLPGEIIFFLVFGVFVVSYFSSQINKKKNSK